MRWTPMLFLGLLAACDSTPNISAYARNTLEPGAIDTDAEFEGTRRDWAGAVSLDGDIGDYTVSASTTGGRVEFEIRNDTEADLSVLNGVEATRVSVLRDGLSGELSFGVADAEGPVYLYEAVAPSALSQELFGGNFMRRDGNDLGGASVSNTDLTLYSVLVGTDDGQVEAFPGHPIEIEVNGLYYRFVLLANWDRTIPDGVAADCTFDELTAYEVVRVERDTADTEILERSELRSIDGDDCL